MKKLLLAILAVFVVLPAYAQEGKKHTLYLGFETESYSYREPKGVAPIRFDGTMYGGSLEYVYRSVFTETEVDPTDPTFLSLQFRYMQGKVDYEGWLQNPITQQFTPLTINDIDDYYMEGRLMAGGIWVIPGTSIELWPYFGLGLRYLVDKTNERSESGYRRTSNYFYAPIGFNAKFYLPKEWIFTLNPEFDWFLSGRQRSRLGDVPAYAQVGWGTITNKQSEGYGLRLSGKFERSIGVTGLFVEPYVRYWRIQESAVDSGNRIIEPNNETKEWGVKVGLMF